MSHNTQLILLENVKKIYSVPSPALEEKQI